MLIQHALGAFELQRRGLRKGRGERGVSLIMIHTLTDEQVARKDLCIAEAWLRTSASLRQHKPVPT